MEYCSNCRAKLTKRIPDGDDRERYVCDSCQAIHYQNPKVVVGCIPEYNGEILLCRRSIEPRYGFWTVPAGFLENGETVSDGASREALEEAEARVEVIDLYTLFNLTDINQVYLIFRSRLMDLNFGAGEESLEVRLFKQEEIPWNEIAFMAIKESLRLFFEDREKGNFPFHMGRITFSEGVALEL
ncbi:NUDIX hydrolase [Thermodesulfobacteriota bacterium]